MVLRRPDVLVLIQTSRLAMLFRIRVGRIRRYQVTNPPKQSTRSQPQSRSEYEPENASQYAPVINLSYTWDEEAQNCSRARISHNKLAYDNRHEKDSSTPAQSGNDFSSSRNQC